MLDATSGNRMMWPNKNPPHTVFMDKEMRLKIPPTIFADNKFCPFRDDVFLCVIYDPPYYVRNEEHSKTSWMFYNPEMKIKKNVKGNPPSHYSYFRTRRELFVNVFRASREFLRVGRRLCFKWCEGDFPLWKILPFFKPWKEIYRRGRRSRGMKRKKKTWWITFIRNIPKK